LGMPSSALRVLVIQSLSVIHEIMDSRNTAHDRG